MDDYGHCLNCGHISCTCELHGIDEINEAQDKAITSLREKIAARKEAHENTGNSNVNVFAPLERVVQPLPEVTLPVGEFGEFSYERFIQIQHKLDVAYGNFLATKGVPEFEENMKILVQCVDSYVQESLRVRYP